MKTAIFGEAINLTLGNDILLFSIPKGPQLVAMASASRNSRISLEQQVIIF